MIIKWESGPQIYLGPRNPSEQSINYRNYANDFRGGGLY